MNFSLRMGDAMAANLKSRKIRGAARDLAARPRNRRRRGTPQGCDAWEPQVPEQRDDEIDCRRIVQGDGGRSPPLYYDEYN